MSEERLSRAALAAALPAALAAAMADALTDLPGRRPSPERRETGPARAERTRSHGALLLRDVDGVETVNDTFGHRTGDRSLAGTGQRGRSTVDACRDAATGTRR